MNPLRRLWNRRPWRPRAECCLYHRDKGFSDTQEHFMALTSGPLGVIIAEARRPHKFITLEDLERAIGGGGSGDNGNYQEL